MGRRSLGPRGGPWRHRHDLWVWHQARPPAPTTSCPYGLRRRAVAVPRARPARRADRQPYGPTSASSASPSMPTCMPTCRTRPGEHVRLGLALRRRSAQSHISKRYLPSTRTAPTGMSSGCAPRSIPGSTAPRTCHCRWELAASGDLGAGRRAVAQTPRSSSAALPHPSTRRRRRPTRVARTGYPASSSRSRQGTQPASLEIRSPPAIRPISPQSAARDHRSGAGCPGTMPAAQLGLYLAATATVTCGLSP